MGSDLKQIAQQLIDANKKVQLIYAFNGSGKTRLSKEFKELIISKNEDEENEVTRNKILYYNAFTEDLFYWDNDLENDSEPKLRIQPNSFTDWLIGQLKELGEDRNIITNFQRYANNKITPSFNEEYKYIGKDYNEREVEITVPAFSEVTFKIVDSNNSEGIEVNYKTIKISKGEESNFIWSIIYTLLEQVISTLSELEADRISSEFNELEYIFIDDPVTSLDENHLIELASNLAYLIKSDTSNLKFIITTHNPLFYNILYNEFKNKYYKFKGTENQKITFKPNQSEKYRLSKNQDETFQLNIQSDDSPFSYHLFLLSEIKDAISNNQIKKYHFNFLRNILEKTSTFLGYKNWEELLEKIDDGNPHPFTNRIINLLSHSKHSVEEVSEPDENDNEELIKLVDFMVTKYGFWQKKEENA